MDGKELLLKGVSLISSCKALSWGKFDSWALFLAELALVRVLLDRLLLFQLMALR